MPRHSSTEKFILESVKNYIKIKDNKYNETAYV